MLQRIKVWAPQVGPQKALIDCPVAEVFFGGARGGGKTDGVLGKWAIKEKRYGKAFNAIMFRRTTVSSEDAIERSKQIFGSLGGKYNESKLIWRMPNGGKVSFAYLDSTSDAEQYQGRNVTDAWVEEAGQYPDPAPIERLFGVLRSAQGVPVQLILTANPGGSGQQWIRERYNLVPFPRGPQVVTRTLEDGSVHHMAVIPSRITDNRILLEGDPKYLSRLQMVGGKALVKAWLDGDWSAIEGAFFDEWSEARHVIPPFEIPEQWLRFRSGDWGSAKPFSIGWWAIASDDTKHPTSGVIIPRGAMVRYREWYGCQPGRPNTGLKLTAEEVGEGIKSREVKETVQYGVLDPAAFSQDGGPSIASRMAGVLFRPADNKRVSQRGAMGGWDMMRQRLKGDADGRAMAFCFSTCRDSIRTIPILQHDEKRPEDLDTDMEDHAADEWRYAMMSRPWVAPAATADKTRPTDYRAAASIQAAGDWQTY
ncbi:phage terminase large subunit [Mesorhizobium sp. B2-3-2]|uniref:phage terminase large subunit n=1 Tax=Mesorhizobium sp. B2-3-2 TaxID=2589961 RepID=UPI0011283997|nr:phage terminase large subunit [Mesorhizobium sp. B2-3-2]TPM37042.1 terminase [Mesorhizobium sp. B2-3-2]